MIEAAQRFYREVGVLEEAITLVTRPDAGHTFLTLGVGNACNVTGSPFLGDCDYDQAEAILKWIYGGLQCQSQREEGKYVIFDQAPFASGSGRGLSSEGVVYIPKARRARRLPAAHRPAWLRAKSRDGGHEVH